MRMILYKSPIMHTKTNIPIIAIIGRPNVGKSTIFNRLTVKWRSIVEDQPGITRDRLLAEMDIEGKQCYLMDTGGLQVEAKTRIERKMSEQALKGVEQADALIFVFDGREGVTPMDREWVNKFRKIEKPKIFLVNKLDDPELDSKAQEFYELGVAPLIAMSAETKRNFSELYSELNKILSQVSPPNPTWDMLSTKLSADGTLDDALVKKTLSISIIGRPNVGKSTLLNTFLNEERCIVDDVPGTTRDPIDSLVEYNGITYRFVDTAGIRKRAKTTERVDKFSVVAALKCIDESNLVLLLLDSTTGPTEQDAHVAGYAFEKERAIIILANKWDEGQHKFTQQSFEHKMELKMNYLKFCPILYISAKTGKNVSKIFTTIEDVRRQYEFSVGTGELNRVFENIVDHHPLPVFKGQEIKMYYSTQVKSSPPSFMVFCNYPDKVHFTYKRYLINAIREAFALQNVPIRIMFRKRK
ncbi:MAG: hypothetical protein ACD_62C00215G0008 [uncultured bacterium]|nr:MAG: hypothetical protein ACD_62C00215G0008 [uncultured bacterium]